MTIGSSSSSGVVVVLVAAVAELATQPLVQYETIQI
jgi:hypothetical protein